MIALAEARRLVMGACRPLAPQPVPLDAALGLVTAAPVIAADAVPPFANTAMDGFAVRAADTVAAPVVLEVVATLAAGADPAGVTIGPGQAARIMTGAAIPAGADAVVMVERTADGGPGRVLIHQAAAPGDHIRLAAEDIAPGEEVFPVGTVLGPAHLGVLASVGRDVVEVHRRPRVAVMSTGDELRETGAPLGPGQIRDSNRRSLLALVRLTGCEPVDLGIVADDPAAIDAALTEAVSACDVLITSGGVSMGEFDYVKAVLDRRAGGDGMTWMQVAIRPAKPLSFGTVDGVPVFGLPGNPVSSMVSFELFARPALRQMMGHRRPERPVVTGVAAEALRRRPDGKVHFARVAATYDDGSGRWRVRPSGGQASNLLTALARADALAILPDGDGVEEGDPVGLLLLTP